MLTKIKAFHKTKPEYAFLIRLAIAYGLLEGTHQYLKVIPKGIEALNTLTYYVAKHTGIFFNWIGRSLEIEAGAYGEEIYQIGYATVLDGVRGVYIAYDCNGFELLVAFIAFLFAFNFKWNHHLFWFIPAGLAAIHLTNVIRVIGLTLIFEFNPDWLEINHKYIFTIVVYLVILAILYVWVRVFNKSGLLLSKR